MEIKMHLQRHIKQKHKTFLKYFTKKYEQMLKGNEDSLKAENDLIRASGKGYYSIINLLVKVILVIFFTICFNKCISMWIRKYIVKLLVFYRADVQGNKDVLYLAC